MVRIVWIQKCVWFNLHRARSNRSSNHAILQVASYEILLSLYSIQSTSGFTEGFLTSIHTIMDNVSEHLNRKCNRKRISPLNIYVIKGRKNIIKYVRCNPSLYLLHTWYCQIRHLSAFDGCIRYLCLHNTNHRIRQLSNI